LQVLFAEWALCPAAPACGRGRQLLSGPACSTDTGTLSPDVTTNLHPAGGSSSTVKVREGTLVA